MTTKLGQYNKALGYLGTQKLSPTAGLTENVKARYELDGAWGDSLKYMLEQGLWKFALKTVQLTPDPDVDVQFGPQYSYSQPDDYVRLNGIGVDGEFINEIRYYREEDGKWLTSVNPIFISYVSNADDKGLNFGVWPSNFCEAHATYLAQQTAVPITRDDKVLERVTEQHQMWMSTAKRLNAVDKAVREKPVGSWVQSRFGNRTGMGSWSDR